MKQLTNPHGVEHRNRRSFLGYALALSPLIFFQAQKEAQAQWPWSRKPLSWDDLNALIEPDQLLQL